jgi:hypothetical protein
MIRLRMKHVVSAIAGAIVGALLFCPLGAISNTISIAATVGAVVGGAVAIGVFSGWISVPTTGGIVTAVIAAVLGTGCDDYSGLMSVPGFLVGVGLTCGVRALVGEFGVRLVFLLPAIIVGVVAIAIAEPIWFVVAAVVGLLTLVWIPGNGHAGMPSRSPYHHNQDTSVSADEAMFTRSREPERPVSSPESADD